MTPKDISPPYAWFMDGPVSHLDPQVGWAADRDPRWGFLDAVTRVAPRLGLPLDLSLLDQ